MLGEWRSLNCSMKGQIFMLPTSLFGCRPAAVGATNYGNVGIMLNSTNSKDAPQSEIHIKNNIETSLKYY